MRKLRPDEQHRSMAKRTWKAVTFSNMTMTERAACCCVRLYESSGLSSPTPYDELRKTGVSQMPSASRAVRVTSSALDEKSPRTPRYHSVRVESSTKPPDELDQSAY